MKRLLYVVLLIAAAAVVPIAPAGAAGACSGKSGVTVVVQFRDEPVQVGCALGDPSSGYEALRHAGFAITNVQSQPQAVCTINSQPDLKQESCWEKTNFWGYWHGVQDDPDKPARSWHFSNSGAYYNPKPGGFEGWHFGAGQADGGPAFAVPPLPSSTPSGTPTAHPTVAHPTGGASNPVVGPDQGPVYGPGPTPSKGATGTTAAGPTATASDDATPTADPSADPTAIDAAGGSPVSARAPAADGSSSKSWLWGVLLIGALGAAAATTAVRRRRG